MDELVRPWKLFTFGIGLALLVAGSFYYSVPDWDIPVSIIMAVFTYLTAGWSTHVVVQRRWNDWPFMLIAAWWCVDGCYASYWYFVDPETLAFMRDANWPVSLSLYWMCGLLWYFNGSVKDAWYKIRAASRP